MNRDSILKQPATVLTPDQRHRYFDDGYLAIPAFIPSLWTDKLRDAADEMIERSRHCSVSDHIFALEEGHTSAAPRLHRLYSPQDHHPAFWEFICSEAMTALAADVVGRDVKFHHAKLNFKTGRGSRGFKWHQDIQAWPHTDYSPVTIGVYIDGCSADQGPLAMVKGSHEGPLYSMYDEAGEFAVCIREEEAGWIEDAPREAPTGPAGTTLLLNCRTVHGSVTNNSNADRPLLLVVYSSADSFAYTPSPIVSPHMGTIVRGDAAAYANFDTRPCELPPDWSRIGYGGPWKRQAASERSADG
ncbi:MAG: phytanoyl-CoA dioxygenase family protein [Gammaproteobacteria bacterium]|nr:phytanoyl-CoA dioxygenase family protein [Gammaproteobacteria bacterium]